MILVTGGAGFVGSHLTKRLLREGRSVVVLDNFNSFYDPQIKRKNIQPLLSYPQFTLVENDIRDKSVLEKIFQKYEITEIIHLAARAGVRGSIQDPFIYEEVNIRGTLSILEVCKNSPVEKFIFASSSSVYGRQDYAPFQEEISHLNPVSPYGVSKLAGELLCRNYNYLYGIPICCLRIFTAYGPAQRPEMAIHKFTRLIWQEKPVPVFGDGDSKRDYTYIEDLVEGFILALNHEFDFDIINLGNSHPVELLKVIKLIESSLEKKARIKYFNSQSGDPPLTYADISKAKKKLGYSPAVPIEEGIERFVHWFRKNSSWLEKLSG